MSVPPIDPAELEDHSEQALVELVYVKVANEVIGGQLEKLSQALTSTSQILTALRKLQDAKNQLQVTDRVVPPLTDEGSYEETASHVFGSSIKPTLISGYEYDTLIGGYKEELQAALQALVSPSPPLSQTEYDQLTQDPNSIYTLGLKVVEDINSVGATAWVMDKYDLNNNESGTYQNNLSLSITAGSSLNDAKKEEVRRYLNIFEEYYKSASVILNKLTDIITAMARNIGRT